MAADERIVARGYSRKLSSAADALHFSGKAGAAYCCAQGPETPMV